MGRGWSYGRGIFHDSHKTPFYTKDTKDLKSHRGSGMTFGGAGEIQTHRIARLPTFHFLSFPVFLSLLFCCDYSRAYSCLQSSTFFTYSSTACGLTPFCPVPLRPRVGTLPNLPELNSARMSTGSVIRSQQQHKVFIASVSSPVS